MLLSQPLSSCATGRVTPRLHASAHLARTSRSSVCVVRFFESWLHTPLLSSQRRQVASSTLWLRRVNTRYVAVKEVDLQQTVNDFICDLCGEAQEDPSLLTLLLVRNGGLKPSPAEEGAAVELDPSLSLAEAGVGPSAWLLAVAVSSLSVIAVARLMDYALLEASPAHADVFFVGPSAESTVRTFLRPHPHL